MKPNRLSRSWDPVFKAMPKKKTKDTEVVKIETDFRDISLSPEAPAAKGRGSDASLNWVWQEVNLILIILILNLRKYYKIVPIGKW